MERKVARIEIARELQTKRKTQSPMRMVETKVDGKRMIVSKKSAVVIKTEITEIRNLIRKEEAEGIVHVANPDQGPSLDRDPDRITRKTVAGFTNVTNFDVVTISGRTLNVMTCDILLLSVNQEHSRINTDATHHDHHEILDLGVLGLVVENDRELDRWKCHLDLAVENARNH